MYMWRKIRPTLLATTSYHWPPELPPLKPYNTGGKWGEGSVRQRPRTKAAAGEGGIHHWAGDLQGGAVGTEERPYRADFIDAQWWRRPFAITPTGSEMAEKDRVRGPSLPRYPPWQSGLRGE